MAEIKKRFSESGPVGVQVARNLADLRAMRRMTTMQLAAKVVELGVPVTASTITKIEKQGRRVTVDELVALAAALDVSPVTLMLPAVDPGGAVPLTAELAAPSWKQAWRWMHGAAPLPGSRFNPFQWLAANQPYLDERDYGRMVFSQPAALPDDFEGGDDDDGGG